VVLNMAATLTIRIQIWQRVLTRFDYMFHCLLQGGVGGRGGSNSEIRLLRHFGRRRGAWRVHIFITLNTDSKGPLTTNLFEIL
jgi:hypothetical protein